MTTPRREHDCPLCGHRFAEGAAACGPCPMRAACRPIACPRCGYECYSVSRSLQALRGIACELRGWVRRSTTGA